MTVGVLGTFSEEDDVEVHRLGHRSSPTQSTGPSNQPPLTKKFNADIFLLKEVTRRGPLMKKNREPSVLAQERKLDRYNEFKNISGIAKRPSLSSGTSTAILNRTLEL